MTDNLTKLQRSRVMASIRGRNTVPELHAKYLFRKLGFSYQPKNVFGRPDFGNKKRRIAIFIDGCFWHGCKMHYTQPASNQKFWRDKILRNKKHDRTVNNALRAKGWQVVRMWEHQILNQPAACAERIKLLASTNK